MTLRTDRLELRPVTPVLARRVLARELADLVGVPGWPHADTDDALRPLAALPEGTSTATFLVVRRDDDAVVGECGWHGPPDEAGEVEIGYGLGSSARRQGYGREAVAALVRWTFAQPGVRRVVAETAPDNLASRRLLESLGADLVDAGTRVVRYAFAG